MTSAARTPKELISATAIASATNVAPKWRKPADQGLIPRQSRISTREGDRRNRGGRGGDREGNGRKPSRKGSTLASQDTTVPAPKLVADPPTTTNTPEKPPPISKPNLRLKPAKWHSATVSEDSISVSSQTSGQPLNRRKRSGKPSTASSNGPSELLKV